MFSTGSRKAPVRTETDRHFRDEPDIAEKTADDATINHEGPLFIDGDSVTGGDPYNTTGKFNNIGLARKYPKSGPD